MQGGLDALLGGAAHHRAGDVAAAANYQIGLNFFHHGFGLRAGEGQIPEGDDIPLDIVQREFPLKTSDLNMMERVACLRYQTVLHALFPACEVDLCSRVCLFDGSGNGQRRVDVSGGAAGCDQYFHRSFLLLWLTPVHLP